MGATASLSSVPLANSSSVSSRIPIHSLLCAAAPSGDHRRQDDPKEDEGIRRAVAGERDQRDPDAEEDQRREHADADLDHRRGDAMSEPLRQARAEDPHQLNGPLQKYRRRRSPLAKQSFTGESRKRSVDKFVNG